MKQNNQFIPSQCNPTKKDVFVFCCALLFSLILLVFFYVGLFLPRGECAEIYKDGILIQTIPLSQDGTYSVSEDADWLLCIENASVRVLHSDCRGQDCVRSGAIGKAGQSILCAPQHLMVRISDKATPTDAVVY